MMKALIKNLIRFEGRMEKAMRYDVALSFAGEDRPYVEATANILRKGGIRVFYDKYEEAQLWGKNLYTHLSDVYSNRAKYTIIFVSKHYAGKLWATHELESAQARAFQENREYLLPARFDDTKVPGLLNTIAYIDLREKTPEEFSRLVLQKLRDSSGGRLRLAHEICGSNNEAEWQNLSKDLVLIKIKSSGRELSVVIDPSDYESFKDLLDDLFTQYLYKWVSPFSYGDEWILVNDPSHLERRIACPLGWVINPGKSVVDLLLLWAVETTLDNEGLLPGTRWMVEFNEKNFVDYSCVGVLTNNPTLANLVVTFPKCYSRLVNYAKHKQGFSFVSLDEAQEYNFTYQLLISDSDKIAPGKIVMDHGLLLWHR